MTVGQKRRGNVLFAHKTVALRRYLSRQLFREERGIKLLCQTSTRAILNQGQRLT